MTAFRASQYGLRCTSPTSQYPLQGLESDVMGLPRDVSSGATVVGFTAAHPLSADHPHHTLPYANHAPRCESGRSQRTMGSLAGFPWLGECSSISITLLLLSQETAGGVMSPYTHHIGFPYNICVFHTRASNRAQHARMRQGKHAGGCHCWHAPLRLRLPLPLPNVARCAAR